MTGFHVIASLALKIHIQRKLDFLLAL